MNERIKTNRLNGMWRAQMIGLVLLTPEPELRDRRLAALFQVYERADPRLRRAVSATFDAVTLRFDFRAAQVIERHRLLTLRLTPDAAARP